MTPKKCMSIAKSLTNTQHMDLEPQCTRLFMELHVQYMKIPSSEHQENMLCTQIVFLFWFSHSEQFMNTTCSPDVLSLEFSCPELVIQ